MARAYISLLGWGGRKEVVLLRRVVVREQGRREEQRAHDGEGAGEEAAARLVLPHCAPHQQGRNSSHKSSTSP